MAKRDEQLRDFIRDALVAGATRADIKAALVQAGWREGQIDGALGAYSQIDFAVPVPTPKQYVSARETFFYLVFFSTLYMSAYALGSLLFHFIEQAFPDPVRPGFDSDRSLRWSLSFLVVATPIFLFTADRIRRMLIADPTKIGSPTRKWLTYVALFIAALFLIGDVVTLVFWLLGGELTVRFLLKVAVVATIAGAIFGYFILDMQRDEPSP